MKSSFGKLRKLALHRHDSKEKREFQSPLLLDELAQASEVGSVVGRVGKILGHFLLLWLIRY